MLIFACEYLTAHWMPVEKKSGIQKNKATLCFITADNFCVPAPCAGAFPWALTPQSFCYLLSDSRVRRIIVPTTCCTRLAPRAGDLLLHRSFSSIYLKGAKRADDMRWRRNTQQAKHWEERSRWKDLAGGNTLEAVSLSCQTEHSGAELCSG